MVGSGAMGASNQLEIVYGEDLTPSSTLRTLYVWWSLEAAPE